MSAKPRVLMVYWRDAASYGSELWSQEDAAKLGPVEMLTVGVLVADNDDCYVLAAEYQAIDGRVRSVLTIPKVCVIDVYEVEGGD